MCVGYRKTSPGVSGASGDVGIGRCYCQLWLFGVGFDPAAGVDEGVNPGGYFVAEAVGGVESALPGEDGTLQMGHHGQMAAVG